MKRQELKEKIKNGAMKTAKYIYKRKDVIMSLVILAVLFAPQIVLADPDPDQTQQITSSAGESQWTFITGLITKWGKRVGGVTALFGGIEFGLGWKDDRADQKTQGLRILVAGLIVLAVLEGADKFLV